jgi:hypothetical protein
MDQNQNPSPNPLIVPVQQVKAETPPQTPPMQNSIPPQNPSIPGHKKMPKLVGLLLLLLLVGLLGGGTYLMNMKKSEQPKKSLTPTAAPKVSKAAEITWDTYTNSLYNFSFQYPSTWQREGTQLVIPATSSNEKAGEIYIHIDKNTEGLLLKDFIYTDEYHTAVDVEGEETASQSAENILKGYGRNALNTDETVSSLVNTRIPGSKTKAYYAKGEDVVILELTNVDDDILKKILSSFTFHEKICTGLTEDVCRKDPRCATITKPSCPTCEDTVFSECREITDN